MAQTTAQIKKQMTDAFIANAVIAGLYGLTPGLSFDDQFSSVSIESIIFDVIAFCMFNLQKLFDAHRDEVKAIIDNTKPHKVTWYATMAKLFQFGFTLVPDEDYYNNTGFTQAAIDASKVVKYAAVEEVGKGLRIKVATLSGSDLAPLPLAQLNGFRAYMQRIKDAGVRLYFTNSAADSLKLTIKIYYDALILDATGARLDGTAATPVPDAIDSFLKSPYPAGVGFNGLFVLAKLTDKLQAVQGVVIPEITTAQARYGALPYQNIVTEYLPDAGYLRIINPTDLVITYIAHEPI